MKISVFPPDGVEETTIGEIEVFGIGSGTTPALLQNDVGNVLMGHVYLGSFDNGEYLAYRMLAFNDFRTDTLTAAHRDLNSQGWINKEISATYPVGTLNPYNQPDWVTTHGPSWNDGDDINLSGIWGGGNPSDMWSLDEVEFALRKDYLKADYFNRDNGTGETTTLAVVSFPAAYLHYNFFYWDAVIDDDQAAKWLRSRCAGVVSGPPYVYVPGGIEIGAKLWNMEEDRFLVSPSETPPLPYQVNLIPVGDLSGERFPVDPWFLRYFEFPFTAPSLGYEGYPWGWFLIDIQDELENDPRTWPVGMPAPYNNPTQGPGIYPGENLMMNYESSGYIHARALPWNWHDLP